MTEARLHDASTIAIEVHGRGPTVLLPVNPQPVEGAQAEELRRWGADPALGRSLIDGLSDAFRVVAFDYEGHLLQVPKPDTLTPANVAGDLLAVADAAGADRFAYYGYSWLALAGLQLGHPDRPAFGAGHGRVPTDRRAVHADAGRHRRDPCAGQLGLGAQHCAHLPPSAEPPDEPAGELDWSQVEVSLTEAADAPVRHPLPGAPRVRRCRRPSPDQVSSPVLCRLGGRDRLRRALGRGAREHGRPGH